ncbi:hypothetical protein F5880DRAFT_1613570 [Lentinula raphanica]|nr:hypothetical protein F5880DRAFT_1613570 [Lentinula raphanica]
MANGISRRQLPQITYKTIADDVAIDISRHRTDNEESFADLGRLQEDEKELNNLLDSTSKLLAVSQNKVECELDEATKTVNSSNELSKELLSRLLSRGAYLEAVRMLEMQLLLPETDRQLKDPAALISQFLEMSTCHSSVDELTERYSDLQHTSLVSLEAIFRKLAQNENPE